ncbi:MAG: RIP metalloprotease RseP [Candidatus Ryanbacteria bacterium RIFCSPLOWO2_01_FULL_48_26]|uniref:Zinc metalloprotease n=1 Tax=Candidatus Ryanbacteria bacterium RIFCSPLOWO2_01_FULL_48_26 TaxID=1802126 RepID=A0A1G2GS62_9BACT|nr:MAG: RIP metalloprotease RseP [Candidatus Ryanbacteria bacterium RIFCSPLOWO2_01_FULL_48_26]
MLIALFVIVGLSLLILGHEAGHFAVAKLFKLKVDEFGFGFPPRMFAWRPFNKTTGKPSETEYSFNWLPFGGFVKIAGENDALSDDIAKSDEENAALKKRLFIFQSAPVRSLIVVAGVVVNFLIGWFLLTLVLLIGTPQALVITQIQPGSPAEQAGFLAGDVVKDFLDSKSFTDFVNQNRGKSITLEVMRGGKDIEITAVPRVETNPNQGALGVFLADAGTERQGFFTAIWEGLRNSLSICWMTLVAFYDLIKNLLFRGSLLEGVVGPVGIFSVAQETGRVGWVYLIQLLSIISLNLAVVNLIPFPALDGGRFFMILIEKIKGSPISRQIESIVNVVGFAFLILLMVLLTFRDVRNLL